MSPRPRAAVTWEPDWCIRPGLTLQEWIEENKLPFRSVARISGLTEAQLRWIIEGAPIKQPQAEALARLPGCPDAKFWLALEHNYRTALAAGKKDVS